MLLRDNMSKCCFLTTGRNMAQKDSDLTEDVVLLQVKVTAHLGHHCVTSEDPPHVIASCVMTRLLMAPGVTRYPVRDGRVRGVMYMPPPQLGPAVGIVDMFGTVGGIMEFRAGELVVALGILAALLKFKVPLLHILSNLVRIALDQR